MRRILVLSPHPDDEALGCGGTIRGHAVTGDEIRVIFLTSGENGGHGVGPADTRRIRECEAEAAAQVLGVRDLDFWRQPDGGLRASPALIERLVMTIEDFRPSVMYAPHEGEQNRDHRAAARLVRSAIARVSASGSVPTVRQFEIWTPLQRLDLIKDISPYVEAKLAAVRAYRSQCDLIRFDEAFLGLARYRGEMHSWPGGDYAEVFCLLRS